MDVERVLTTLGWRPQRRASKFIAYFQLVGACDQPGCPVCRCLQDSTFRSLDALLYEQVNDPGTRALLDRSWGFCAWHAWLATEIKNAALGLAIIYRDLLDQCHTRLSASQRQLADSPRSTGWRRFFRRWQPVALARARLSRTRCLLCESLARAEQGYLLTLLEYVEDPDFDRAYARSTGICLPHLTMALDRHPAHAGAAPLLARTRRKLERLREELRGFIDKHDYRRHAPYTEEEAASWTNAIALLVGRREIFGNELSRLPSPRADAQGRRDDPEPESMPAESAEALRERLEALAFEKGRLELRLREFTRQLGDESSRAAALHYRLWSVSEDRNVLEMNLAGERAAARTWESVVRDLRTEIEQLKTRLAKYEPPPDDAD